MTAVLERLAASQEAMAAAQQTAPQKQAEAIQKLRDPSSPVASGVSVFNPRGDLLPDYKFPTLVCEIHAPHKIHPNYHGLDREEVELCNLLIAQGQAEYMIELVDGTKTKLTVQLIKNDVNGKVEKARFVTGWTEEKKGLYPAMRVFLREMLGPKADTVMSMKTEVRLIEAGELAVSR
jgi:hypothetical protein